MCSITAANQPSFQWMQDQGVDLEDIRWLDAHQGSVALHSPEAVERVEKMYHKALNGIAASDSPAQALAKALLN